jgi:hypothetical protein
MIYDDRNNHTTATLILLATTNLVEIILDGNEGTVIDITKEDSNNVKKLYNAEEKKKDGNDYKYIYLMI